MMVVLRCVREGAGVLCVLVMMGGAQGMRLWYAGNCSLIPKVR